MQSFTATQARQQIYKLVAQTESNHEPIQITGKHNNAVMLSQSDWDAIQETLYLMSVPGMADSIIEGMKADAKTCSTTLFEDDAE